MKLKQKYPTTRLRRLRQAPWVRRLVQENHLSPSDFILPLFVIEGKNKIEKIPSMPGVLRMSVDKIVEQTRLAKKLGIPAVALFPKTPQKKKDELGSESYNPYNLVCTTIKAIKDHVSGVGVMCDVALDPYTSHGHDGLIKNGKILNDETIAVLIEQSLNQVKAGCDILGPSDMMDGRVGEIRKALEKNNFKDTLILSYAAKYASSFYGPFRDAVGSKTSLQGDKKTYQQDPANSGESLREVALDLAEGADMVMVKPGIAYLDIVSKVKNTFNVPTFVYQVSGEYAMIQAAAQKGWVDGEKIMLESLLAMKRAGATGILTYAAMDVAKKL